MREVDGCNHLHRGRLRKRYPGHGFSQRVRSPRYAQVDASLIFPNVKNDKLKKKFSEKENKSRRISSKAPIKRLVTQANYTVISCLNPCKIRLKHECVRGAVDPIRQPGVHSDETGSMQTSPAPDPRLPQRLRHTAR